MNDRSFLHQSEREGILTKNPLFTSGVIIAPAVAACTNIYSGIILASVFTVVTVVTLALCRYVPRRIVYTLRITLYTLVASLVYVPVHIYFTSNPSLEELYSAVGIYAPLLITNSLITLRSETKFYRLAKPYVLKTAGYYVIGYDLALILFSAVRGFLIDGTVLGEKVLSFTFPILAAPYGGFILLALMSAAFRWMIQILNGVYKKDAA